MAGSPQQETVSDVRERLASEQQEEAPAAPQEGFVICPVDSCGRQVKSLRHHMAYMVKTGERAHVGYQEIGAAAAEPPQEFSPGAGDALVAMLLAAVLEKRPETVVPDGWKERAGQAYQHVLDKRVGPWIGEKSDIVEAIAVSAELLMVNVLAAQMERAQAAANGEAEAPGLVP